MVLFGILKAVLFVSLTVSHKTCAPISSFTEVFEGKYLASVAFHVQDGVGLMECVKHCQRRRRCKSLNYIETSGTCELNYISETNELSRRSDSVYTDIKDWSSKFAGICSNKICPMNSTCSDVNNQPVCDVTYCDSGLIQAQIDIPFNHDGYFKEGEKVQLTCPRGYHSDAPVCGSQGIWNGNGTCQAPPLDCDAVKECKPSAQDGNYWILPTIAGVNAVMVFCAFSKESMATAYITLDETNNFSVFPRHSECESSVEYCEKTTYSKYKLRIANGFSFVEDKEDITIDNNLDQSH